MSGNVTYKVFETTSYSCATPTLLFTDTERGEDIRARRALARRMRAHLHQLAAEAELATSNDDGWLVRISIDSDIAGRIQLELVDGNTDEAKRGLAMLEQLAAKHMPAPIAKPKRPSYRKCPDCLNRLDICRATGGCS